MATVRNAQRRERRGTAAQWTAVNPILKAGELGILQDGDGRVQEIRVGDGTSAWADLGDTALLPKSVLTATYLQAFLPEAYGAVGDGATDDSAAIQSAIDAASAAGGGVVEGNTSKVYAVAAGLTQPDNVKLRNLSLKRVINVFDVISNADPASGNTGLALENVTIDGDRATGGLSQHTAAHRFSGVRWINVTDAELDGVSVVGTVNGEAQAEGNRAAIVLEDCSDITCRTYTGDNDGTGLMFFGATHNITVEQHVSRADTGSGLSSGGGTYDNTLISVDVEDNGIGQASGTYSAVSINGPRYSVGAVRAVRANAAGLNLGHPTNPADGAVVSGPVICTDCELSGIIVRGSDGVQVSNAYLHNNGISATATNHGNVRVYDSATRTRWANIRSSGAANAGMRFQSGSGHSVIGAEVWESGSYGIDASVPVTLNGVKSYNNGQIAAEGAGILLNGVSGAVLTDVECYDDQETATQDYGLWLAGGGDGVALLGVYLHDNATTDLHTTSGAAGYRRLAVREGADLWTAPPAALVKTTLAGGAQSIPHNTFTLINWNDVVWEDVDLIDTAGATPSRFTIPASLDGKRIALDVTAFFNTNATGIRRVRVLKNGTAISDVTVPAPAVGECGVDVSAYDTAATGDYYEAQVFQSSGGSLDLMANARTWAVLRLA